MSPIMGFVFGGTQIVSGAPVSRWQYWMLSDYEYFKHILLNRTAIWILCGLGGGMLEELLDEEFHATTPGSAEG